MKKTVKFSGTTRDEVVYLTAVLIPKIKEKVKNYVDLITSSVDLFRRSRNSETTHIYSFDRYAQIEAVDNGIVVHIIYKRGTRLSDVEIEDAKRDGTYIIEQIETMIDALEEQEPQEIKT